MKLNSAISAVNRAGALLVFPIANRTEPDSLWRHFFPRTAMRWEWDDSGDHRVADLWHLRAKLAESRRVVYSKWYQGRATLISVKIAPALLSILNPDKDRRRGLGVTAKLLLELLESDSPLSTKQLRKMADLQGKYNEKAYVQGLKELWNRLLIVGCGEVDDGAFPSLAIGASSLIFEELWQESRSLSPELAQLSLETTFNSDSLFARQLHKLSINRAALK